MKKLWKRVLSVAMASCMVLGLMTTGASAYRWETESDSLGEMLQKVYDENGNYSIFIVQMLPVGSVINFSEPVDVATFKNEDWSTTYTTVEKGVTSYTVADTAKTYTAIGADGGMAFFRGAASQQTPITIAKDLELGGAAIQLSKPVVDITIAPLEYYDFWEGITTMGNYLIYEVPVGTVLKEKGNTGFGMILTDVWDAEGKEIQNPTAAQLPTGEAWENEEEAMGYMSAPVTLDKVGYYYLFRPEAISCDLPVFKVVDEQPAEYTPRTANFSDMNWSKPFVEKAYGYGWMEGMGGDKFDPQGNLTIAQAITLAARLHSAQVNMPIPTSEGPWYQSYLDYCEDNWLLSDFFDPYSSDFNVVDVLNNKATRLDMVKILSRAAGVPSLGWNDEETVTVPDVNKDEVNGGYLVYDWYRAGIVSGDAGTGNFRPDSSITRGEVAVILCNLLGL